MNELYMKLKNESQYMDAYIVIKNLVNKDPGNIELFKEFIDINLEISMFNIVFEERKRYIDEANLALALFSETVEMNENSLILIKETTERIRTSFTSICQNEHQYYERQNENIYQKNIQLLDRLAEISDLLRATSTQKEFDTVILEVSEVEKGLNKAAFTDTQNETYESLTKNYSQLISSKMEDLHHKSLLAFNQNAVICFRNVFEAFSKDKGKYKDSESNLKNLMTNNFFIYDTTKLFNESLIYYNHVYAIIFQTVNDKLKYKLTEWAIKTPKLKG